MSEIRLAELDSWIKAEFVSGIKDKHYITISAGLRGEYEEGVSLLPLLEVNGAYAHTARILLPNEPEKIPSDIGVRAFTETGNWWTGWVPVLIASSLLSPVVDPCRAAELMHETRRIRFFCDTNVLSQGSVAWLLTALSGKADIVTSAVVDRELAAWADRNWRKWKAKTVSNWVRVTQYRLAWRLTECPPSGVVVDRLSPEQGALMLAKLQDEGTASAQPTSSEDGAETGARKSPDADILLIELARGLIRDQPRNARIVYLTGDRNNARAAANALGGENVLYAASDDKGYWHNKIVTRGWWRPDGPLGSALVPPISHLLWNLLAACAFLVLEFAGKRWLIRQAFSVPNGVPSDWADPWLEISELTPTRSTPSGSMPVKIGAGLRPAPNVFFEVLWNLLSNSEETSESPAMSKEGHREVQRILIGLEAMDSFGQQGTRIQEFRHAWESDNLDWFHAEMMRLPGYSQAIELVRSKQTEKFSERQRTQLSMARALGQVARIEGSESPLFVGDAQVSVEQLLVALETWLPNTGDTLATEDICEKAANDLQLTPARFEVAMQRLWDTSPTIPFEGRTGGTASTDNAERVVELSNSGYRFKQVAPGALTFGRGGPIRFIARTR